MSSGSRMAIAFVLSFVIMFVFYKYLIPQPAPQVPAEQVQTQTTTPSQTTQTIAPTPTNTKPISSLETNAPQKDIIVETPKAMIVLSTQGAVLKSYELKDYRREVKKDAPFKNLLTETAASSALFLGIKNDLGFSRDKNFKLVSDEDLGEKRVIKLEWQNSLIRIQKTFTFNALSTPYAVQVDYKLTNLSSERLSLEPYFEDTVRQKVDTKKTNGILSFLTMSQSDLFSRLYFKDGKLNSNADWKGFTGGMLDVGNINWTAISDRYFMLAMIPDQKLTQEMATNFDRKDDFTLARLVLKKSDLAPGESTEGTIASYLGPKLLDEMVKLGVSLEASVDYGWFKVLAKPILWLMTFLHHLIPSWGLVIIALTVIVKLLLHPINKKSMTSMKAMQQLQPKLKEIREKFADDKQRQNQETMQLFKTHKVNPMGGCLPMLLQMPLYIVLYKILWNAVELYHTPFLWYKDMSAPDPLFIAPILLGVSMILQQKFTPSSTGDAAQQKMMMYTMPVMFTLLMLFLPVGLVVYIFANTAISVVQQYMMKKDLSFSSWAWAKIRGGVKEEPLTHHQRQGRKLKD